MSQSAADNWLKPDKKYDGSDPSMLQLLQGKLNLHAKKHGWEKLLTGAQDATDEMLIEMHRNAKLFNRLFSNCMSYH